MNDTAPWAAEAVRHLLAQRTPGERVAMASRSFAAARALMIAGIRQQDPGISDEELRLRVLELTYRADFEPAAWARLVELWREAHGPGARESPPATAQ